MLIQISRRLIGKQAIGMTHQGTGYGGTLTFAAGKFRGAMFHARFQSHFGEQFRRRRLRFAVGQTANF